MTPPILRFAAIVAASAFASACVCVTGRGLVITPSAVEVVLGGTASFAAEVKGVKDPAVAWSVEESEGGSITQDGVYTAPTRTGTFHVVATSVSESALRATATISVSSPTVKVRVGPQVAQVEPGATVYLTAGVSGLMPGDPTTVSWSVAEPGGGTVDGEGRYTAPATPGEYHVVATAHADGTKSATGLVRVALAGPIPADRLTIFNPGLNAVGGIPNRTTIYKVLTPSGGDDTDAINDALAACPDGQVVKLGPGLFKVSAHGVEIKRSNVTLRGSGPAQTTVSRADAFGASVISVGNIYSSDKQFGSVNLAAEGKKGAYTIRLAAAPVPPLAVGELVYLDSVTNPAITRWSDQSPPGHVSREWFGRMDRPITQVVEVAKVNGTEVTFTTPLHIDFLTAFQAQLTRFGEGDRVKPATRWVGVEDLAVEKGRGGDGGGNVHFWVTAYSWARNIVASQSLGTSVALDSTFRTEIRDSFIHTSANPTPGGDGYLLGLSRGASDNLIENNVIWSGNKVMVMRATGGGNVVAYNYAQDAFGDDYRHLPEVGLNASHMATSHHVLFEGNESFNFDSDSVWGNSAYIIALRNNFTGLRTSKAPLQLADQVNRRAIGLTRWSWWYTFLGNVLGYEGQQPVGQQLGFVYELRPNELTDGVRVPMWKLGYNGEDGSQPADAKVLATVIRHGNFDYVTGSVTWDAAISDRALPQSLYLREKPAFFGENPWPWVNPEAGTAAERTCVLPAKERFEALP